MPFDRAAMLEAIEKYRGLLDAAPLEVPVELLNANPAAASIPGSEQAATAAVVDNFETDEPEKEKSIEDSDLSSRQYFKAVLDLLYTLFSKQDLTDDEIEQQFAKGSQWLRDQEKFARIHSSIGRLQAVLLNRDDVVKNFLKFCFLCFPLPSCDSIAGSDNALVHTVLRVLESNHPNLAFFWLKADGLQRPEAPRVRYLFSLLLQTGNPSFGLRVILFRQEEGAKLIGISSMTLKDMRDDWLTEGI